MNYEDGPLISVGDRVELHPGTDVWMMGDRYGDVAKIGRTKVHVQMGRSGKTRPMAPERVRLGEKVQDRRDENGKRWPGYEQEEAL